MDDQRQVARDVVLAGIARKIDALQLEMATLKAAIDNVPAEIGAALPDISPTLQMLVVGVAGTKTAVDTMGGHPALKQRPADYTADLDNRRAAVAAKAAGDAEGVKKDLQTQLKTLSDIVGAARIQHYMMLLSVGTLAVCAGLMLSPWIAARTDLGPTFATWAMGESTPWKAANRILEHVTPGFTEKTTEAWNLSVYKGNPATLQDCRAAAKKAQKDVQCSIVVRVPED